MGKKMAIALATLVVIGSCVTGCFVWRTIVEQTASDVVDEGENSLTDEADGDFLGDEPVFVEPEIEPEPEVDVEPEVELDPEEEPEEESEEESEFEESTIQPDAVEDVFVAADPPASDSAFVKMSDYIPDLTVELKYATTDNFTDTVIYDFTDAYLRYGTVKKLIEVQAALAEYDLYLKVWDAYRPVSAQYTLWEVYPDSTYVANPNTGVSSHSRGSAVDVTLVDARGIEVEMPTGFDDFSTLADRDYSDCTDDAAANAQLLQDVMEDAGMTGYWGEWWHFSDTTSYSAEYEFEPE